MALFRQWQNEISKITVDTIPVTNAIEIANHFNKYFQSVFSECDENTINSGSPLPQNVTISRAGVLTMLLNINPKKSSGPDEIPNAF